MSLTFPEVVKECRHLTLQPGLGALGGNRSRVAANDPRAIRGSVNIETAQKKLAPQDPAWDYGIGLASPGGDTVIWLEIHSADSEHVAPILAKLDALLAFLRDHAAELRAMPKRFVWLATGPVHIAPNGTQQRKLNARGIILKSKQINLESVL